MKVIQCFEIMWRMQRCPLVHLNAIFLNEDVIIDELTATFTSSIFLLMMIELIPSLEGAEGV